MNRDHLSDVELRIRPKALGRTAEVWIYRGEFASDKPISFEWPTPTSELRERVDAIVIAITKDGRDLADRPQILDERTHAKGLLLAELVPQGLVATLKTAAGRLDTLLIDSHEPWFPWELLWLQIPGTKVSSGRYLAEAFDVGRWHGEFTPPMKLPGRKIAWVMLDSAQLPSVAKERTALSGIVGAGREIVDAPRTWEPLRLALEAGGFDIWHFAGEGIRSTRGDPDTHGLTLEDYITLSGEDLLKLRGSWRSERPLVFLNACRSGVSAASSGPARGLPIRFLEAGAGAVLATLWPVTDSFASAFSENFYRRVLTGCPIAKAVRKARFAAKRERPGDPSWLAYALFAHPLANLMPQLPKVSSSPPSFSAPPDIERSWTGEKQFKTLVGQLKTLDEEAFLAIVRPLLSVVWAPPEMIRFDGFRRMTDRNFILPALEHGDPDRAFGFRLFGERGDMLGAEHAKLFEPVLERFAAEGPKVEIYVLLTNCIPSAVEFRQASQSHLQRLLAGRAARVEFWGPQEIVRASFNAMATRLQRMAFAGGIENLQKLNEATVRTRTEPIDRVPLSRSFLVADQNRLREESSNEEVVADPALALAEPRGEHYTLLLGEFGFGKTTALERAVRASGNRQILYLPGASIPPQVHGTKDLLELLVDFDSLASEVTDDEREILSTLVRPTLQHLVRNPDFPVALAIDGLDESSYLSHHDGLHRLFNGLAQVYVPIVLAMRSEYWYEMRADFEQISGQVASHAEPRLRRIKRIELRDWQSPQIATFLAREIESHSDPEARERLIALMDSIDRPEFEELYGDIPRRPLFLRFIVDTVADEGLPAVRETRVHLFERWVLQKIDRDVYAPSAMVPGTRRKPLLKEGESLETVRNAAWEAMTYAAAAMCEESAGRLLLLPTCTLDRALAASPRLRTLAEPLPLFLHSLLGPAPSRFANPKRIRFSHRAFQEFFLAWAIHHHPDLLPRGEVPQAVRHWVEEIAQTEAGPHR